MTLGATAPPDAANDATAHRGVVVSGVPRRDGSARAAAAARSEQLGTAGFGIGIGRTAYRMSSTPVLPFVSVSTAPA